MILLGLFSFEPITMFVCLVLGGGLVTLGVVSGKGHQRSPGTEAATDGSTNRSSDPGPNVIPRTGYREHIPPAPRGEAVRPWAEVPRTVEVVGEFFRQGAYEKIFQGLPRDGTWLNLDLEADLYPDPSNPHSRSGGAISIWISGFHVGFLADGEAAGYSPILRDMAEKHGQYLRVLARVSGYYQTQKRTWHIDTRLGLPEPRDVLPRNQLPQGELELIPIGRVIQVAGEENHMDYLGSIVDPSGPAHYAATLRPTQMGTRTFYDTVQVFIDGHEVGVFSRAMGEQTVALVKLIGDAGKVPVVRATVEGNALRAEVKVRMQRSAEVDHERIHQLQAIARERRANSTRRGEPFDWDDDELAEQQDRDAEDGGA
ncbi:hypothetical protein [Brachybacterium squillarum]|uniref:hypothetical protein n=1 Tax=Brachybacterium squillarum TaxID=661979 RepID=UPI002221E7EA|nr:hypothetical protein [Brachybacterium squillarum]MCW1805272.1 hypothetical protein [Brachybacterium squillarum]